MRMILGWLTLMSLGCSSAPCATPDAGPPVDSGGPSPALALAAVTDLAGTYTGHWEVFALDATGATLSVFSWDDTVVASNPHVDGDRAVVSVIDTLNFPDPTPDQVVEFIEGFQIEPDGSVGPRFFEMAGGPPTVESVLSPNAYAYDGPATEQDRPLIMRDAAGFALDQTRHYTFKVVERTGGMEHEDITRMTRAVWTDGTVIPFVSMRGYHDRPVP